MDADEAVDGRAPSTASWKTLETGVSTSAHTAWPCDAIAATISWAVVDSVGVVRCVIDSALKYRRSATVHSSSCSSRIAPTRRMTATGFGKIPTTFERALAFCVQPLERIRAVQLPLVRNRQRPIGQHVFGGLLEQRGGARKAGPEAIGDLPELRQRGGLIGLREDRADDRRDRFAGALRHRREEISHDVHAAAWAHVVPVSTVLIACVSPSCASEITRRTPVKPRFTTLRRTAVQTARSSEGPTSMPRT